MMDLCAERRCQQFRSFLNQYITNFETVFYSVKSRSNVSSFHSSLRCPRVRLILELESGTIGTLHEDSVEFHGILIRK